MNHKFVTAIAAFLIVGMVLSAIPMTYAQTVLSFGPQLQVVTIPQDNQDLKTGVMILGLGSAGLVPGAAVVAGTDYMSQHKLLVTYNGQTLTWQIGTPGPLVACNFLEKDKVNVVPDPKSGSGDQGPWENLMTNLVDVSSKFVCKPRWKSPATGVYESAGVLDVYYTGPTLASVMAANPTWTLAHAQKAVGVWIADTIMVVEVSISAGKTVIFGSDMQDICVLGWAVPSFLPPGTPFPADLIPMAADWIITKPDGTQHYIWMNAMGAFLSCEDLALAQKDLLGIMLPTGQDPLAP